MKRYYAGKTILITGSTGFIGSVLLQTILAKLPDVRKIYCLYRSKPGIEDPRIAWIKGDVTTLPGWGLDEASLATIQEEVQVIFHLAAYTRWDRGVRDQVLHNTLPGLYAAELASQCKRLESCVIASSYWAACHIHDHTTIAETVFQDYCAEDELTEILDGGSEARLAEWPNAYAYSKNLLERLAHQRYPELPIVMARITSACGAWEFPVRGYCRYDNALPAFLRAIAAGGVRVFPESMQSAINDCIPVDICANLLLANAFENANGSFTTIHCSSANRNLPVLSSIAEQAGDIEYHPTYDALYSALSRLPDQRAAALNKLIVDTYRLALESKYVFLDYQARRPLLRMSVEDHTQFPIDVNVVGWDMLIGSMVEGIRTQGNRLAA